MPLTGAAAARLYDDHVDAVHALVTRRVGPALGAPVTGEVFEQAVRTWDRFDSERGTERLFLYGSATVVLRKHTADERRHLEALRPPDPTGGFARDPLVTVRGPGGDVVDHHDTDETERPDDQVSRTMTAVVELAPDDRDILLLSLWEGCQHAAVAEAMDLAVGTVRSSLSRIRRDIKKAVQAAGQPASVKPKLRGPSWNRPKVPVDPEIARPDPEPEATATADSRDAGDDDDVPDDEMTVDDTPDDGPADDIPADEMTVEETPADAPVDEMTVDEAADEVAVDPEEAAK